MNKDPSPEKMTDDDMSFLAYACWLIPRTALATAIALALDTWNKGLPLHWITIALIFFLILFCLILWKTGNKVYKLYEKHKKDTEKQ